MCTTRCEDEQMTEEALNLLRLAGAVVGIAAFVIVGKVVGGTAGFATAASGSRRSQSLRTELNEL